METKKKFTLEDLPGGFALCMRNDCKLCDHCLRNMAYKDVVTEKLWAICLVNPLRVKPSEACEYFRTDEPATYARGFVKMKQEMLPRQYDEFSVRLIGKFGRTGYYERRRGERLCSPKEIEFIQKVLQEMKLPNFEFDAYEKHLNWYD